MKRLLTYGLLLLTILAGHFVVSACQDDLPENTEIMVTFTTRATPGADDSDSPELEQMHDLSVIMLRSDGTIVDKHSYKPEPGQKNPSSVKFTFSTTIPNPGGEDFTFFAIANEETLPWEDLSVGQTLSEPTIEALKETEVNTDINTDPIPQTDYWTVHVPQSNYTVEDRTLQFAGSKISVVFNNMTKEPQSLSNIRITGITPNTQGYLFKQDGTDYIDSKDNSATPISFGNLTLAAPTTVDDETTYASDSVAYYTYPLGEGNFNSPMLYATWGDETEPRTLDLSSITSLKRNEHLRIEITLTPAGDITVNYTIDAWEENKVNIGDTPPTTPGNGYNVDEFKDAGDIEIGGGEDDPWSNLGGTIIAGGSDVFDNWSDLSQTTANSWLPIPLDEEYMVVGYKLAIAYTVEFPEKGKGYYFNFVTGSSELLDGPHEYGGPDEAITIFTFDADDVSLMKKNGLVLHGDGNNNIQLKKMAIVKPY